MKKTKTLSAENLETKHKLSDMMLETVEDTYYPLPTFISTNEFSTQYIMDLWNCTEPPLANK